MHALLFLLFYHNTVLLIDEIICSECCFPTLTLLSFDFLICILSFIFLIFTFLPFFLWLAQRQLTGWKKLKGSGLLWRLVPEFSLRSVTVSLCARAECLQMSFQLTSLTPPCTNMPSRETGPGLCQLSHLTTEFVFFCRCHHRCWMNKTHCSFRVAYISSCLAGLVC